MEKLMEWTVQCEHNRKKDGKERTKRKGTDAVY